MNINELVAALQTTFTPEGNEQLLAKVFAIFKAHIPRKEIEARQHVFSHQDSAPRMSMSLTIPQGPRAYWWINLEVNTAKSVEALECRVSAWVRDGADDTHLLGRQQDVTLTGASSDSLDDIAQRAVATICRFHRETLVELGIHPALAEQVAVQQWTAQGNELRVTSDDMAIPPEKVEISFDDGRTWETHETPHSAQCRSEDFSSPHLFRGLYAGPVNADVDAILPYGAMP